jgi:Asp-tRNA(Asn)/Glu-tRNA(Gln) amidotransferase C subunit
MTQVADRFAPQPQPGQPQFGFAQRSDALRPSLSHEDALRNAPASGGAFFQVPKVIER